ncbi:cytotoxic translational repressor of toxin-antitoxin stability system [Enterobacteriaceae bacterium strain FGI 57]|jgi:Cytotoxic translational repressor of toxin-antitoxin stability system|nr:cytotoxic translational repressor of toxin-antitoxin stability system [Enterobacteriaceae bacterium strain FGI 57]
MVITWSRVARRQLENIDVRYRQKVTEKIMALNDRNAPMPDLAKLSTPKDHYRLRVGDYRIIFTVIDDENTCHILAVKRRTTTTYLHEEKAPYGYSAD